MCACVLRHFSHVFATPPGSSVHRVFLARILEWVAMHTLGDLPNAEIEPTLPTSPALQVDSLLLTYQGAPFPS